MNVRLEKILENKITERMELGEEKKISSDIFTVLFFF
jgi:hypothetical protein